MGMRTWRMLVALLGVLGLVALAPQLAAADTPGTISGTVTNTNSTPQDVSGVSVRAMNLSTDDDYNATTASDGTYTLSGLPAGSYTVVFEPGSGEDYVYQYYPDKSNAAAAQAVTVTAGQTTANVNAALAPGASISGEVTDAAGNPVSNATVYVQDYGTGYSPNYVYSNSATTGQNGQWSVVGLPSGTFQVEFLAPDGTDYAGQYYNDATGQNSPTPVTLAAGSTTSGIDAALTMGGQISGNVTDGVDNLPEQGVEVAALDAAGEQSASTYTDSNGNYTLSGLTASAPYRVEFTPPDGSSLAGELYPSGSTLPEGTPVPVTVGQTTPNIDETLGEGGSISGVVTDAATGYPIGGAFVMLTDDAGNEVYPSSERSAEPDGTYDFTNLAPGSYKVEFDDGDFFSKGGLAFQFYNDASTLSAASSVTVGAGQAVQGINGALTQGGILKGHVTDAMTGQGVADADVEVVDANDNFLTVGLTNANGDYEIPGIALGSYYVEVMTEDGPPNYEPLFYGGTATLQGATPVTISAGATTAGIDVTLPRASATASMVTAAGQTATNPTTTATGQTTGVMPGPPTLSRESVSGLSKGKPVVKFRLASGSNGAPRLRSFKVKLPAGLALVAGKLGQGVKVTGGGKVTEKVTGGQLVVTLVSPAKTVTVTISSPALKVTNQLAAKAAKKTAGALRISVTATLASGAARALSFTVKNPT